MAGRDEELRFVNVTIRRARGSRGVVLAGAAGVGKTRLAREALGAAARRGAVTRWAVGTAAAQALPLGAFSGLLRDFPRDGAQVVRRGIEALTDEAVAGGLVVGVDDAHLLDDTSASLLHQLVLRGAAAVIVTVRTGEPAPDAVTSLWKDLRLPRLDIQALGQPESAALLEKVLGGTIDSTVVGRIWALTRGNALYLRHLVNGELDAGRLREIGGVWRWSGDLKVSPSLAELVQNRMGQLPEPVRDVVDVLALGEPLGITLLAGLTDRAAVEEAEELSLVTVERSGRRTQARLAHPLYGEVRRARIGQLRTRRLCGQIATALADTGGRRVDDTLRRAALLLDSDIPPDPALLTMAARDAITLLDLPLAERLARVAVEAADDFDARLALGLALSWMNRGAEAEVELATLANRVDGDVQRVMLVVPRAANLFWPGRRPAEAEALLDAVEVDVTDKDARGVITAARAAFHAFQGRSLLAVEAAAAAPGSLPAAGVLLIAYASTVGLGALGRADEIEPVVSPVYAQAAESFMTAVGAFGLCDIHMHALHVAGYLHAVKDLALKQHQRTADMPGFSRLRGISLRGQAARYQGRLAAAIRDLREARSGFLHVDQEGFAFRCLMNLTHALAMAGDVAGAREALAELEAERHPAFVFCDTELLLARAWVAAAEGAVSEAIRLAHDAAAGAAALEQPAYEVMALHAAVCFGDRTVARRLAELAHRVDGPRGPAAAAQAAALAAEDGAGLEAASERFEEMGDLLAAADAAAQAAAAYTRQGRRGSAHAAAARAHRLAELCEGARTPALIAAARPLPLTEREREIVTLAAQGLSNREVADRLVVSVRTVEGHLYRATAKLGLSTRADLAALMKATDASTPRW